MATILVVDDNATNRALLVRVLERDGHRVVEASNGAEALGLVWIERPDVVLTDVVMPRVDGYAFDRELRNWPQSADIPVIFHTATYSSTEVQQLVGTRRRRVLPKPSDIQMISTTVAAMLDEAGACPEGDADVPAAEHLDVLNAKLMQKVRELELADRERRELLASVVRAQEEERERIAGEIHDDPVQAMTAVAMRLELAGPSGDDVAAVERHEKLLGTVRHAIGRLRRLIFELHPPALEQEGLAAAVEALLAHAAAGGGPAYEVDDQLRRQPEMERRTLLYRVVQEAATNAVKHAGASHLTVTLQEERDGVVAVVADDGRGFDLEEADRPRPGHLGLTSMRQRTELVGGSCRIESRPGGGTTVRVWVPHPRQTERSA
jgi:signal transduction histidine kinase